MGESHKRVLDALELREPDRVPIFDLMLEDSIVNEMLGRKPSFLRSLYANPMASKVLDRMLPLLSKNNALAALAFEPELKKLAMNGAAAAVKMGYDAAWIPFVPIFRFQDTRTATDIFGRTYQMEVDENGNVTNPLYRDGLFKSEDDWKAWDKRAIMKLPEKANRVYSKMQREYGKELFIFGFISYGIYENCWQSLGFERFVTATRRDKDFIKRYVKFQEDFFCEVMQALGAAGLPAVAYTDDLAYRSGPMISPKMVDELFGDSYRRVVETAHGAGMKILMHSCGNTTKLLPFFADCGFDAVHPLEPTAGMTLKEAKELVGDRLCLVGNLDVTHTLVDASREEVVESVRSAIRDAGRGGGYILSPDHSYQGVSIERLRWMVEAGREYGRYPLEEV
ncbi:MAG: uroporphyrinogen decarboxylase family protein [Candidatus Geothermincolia bacterium]